MKTINFLGIMLLFVCINNNAKGQQYCTKPKPMTNEQMQLVSGIWRGNYTYKEKEQNFTVTVSVKNGQLVCEITNPPITGKETSDEYHFCDSGEFHFQKLIGDMSYEFHGVPADGRISGTLVVRKKDNQVPIYGEFTLVKS